MAYIVGIVSKKEKAILEARGWDVELALDYNIVGGDETHHLLHEDEDSDKEAVLIFVDSNLFDIMSGPDWEKGSIKIESKGVGGIVINGNITTGSVG